MFVFEKVIKADIVFYEWHLLPRSVGEMWLGS